MVFKLLTFNLCLYLYTLYDTTKFLLFYRVSLSILNNDFRIGMFDSRSVLRHFSLQQIQPNGALHLSLIQIIIQSASTTLHILLCLKDGCQLYVNETVLHHVFVSIFLKYMHLFTYLCKCINISVLKVIIDKIHYTLL